MQRLLLSILLLPICSGCMLPQRHQRLLCSAAVCRYISSRGVLLVAVARVAAIAAWQGTADQLQHSRYGNMWVQVQTNSIDIIYLEIISSSEICKPAWIRTVQQACQTSDCWQIIVQPILLWICCKSPLMSVLIYTYVHASGSMRIYNMWVHGVHHMSLCVMQAGLEHRLNCIILA